MYASILRFGRINERVIFYRNWLASGSVRWHGRDLEIPTHSLLTLYGYDDRLPISLFKLYFRWAVSHAGWRQCLATSDLTRQLRSSWVSIVTTADLTRILSVGLCEKEYLEISEVEVSRHLAFVFQLRTPATPPRCDIYHRPPSGEMNSLFMESCSAMLTPICLLCTNIEVETHQEAILENRFGHIDALASPRGRCWSAPCSPWP